MDSAAEIAESSTADDTSQSCIEQTYGCSHYQRKCLLVVWIEPLYILDINLPAKYLMQSNSDFRSSWNFPT